MDLTAHLGLAQSGVSAHLVCLRDGGLLASRPVGGTCVLSVVRPELVAVLTAARTRPARSNLESEPGDGDCASDEQP